jgi:hypothetical protein
MSEFLIAQKYTTNDPWTLFIGGQETYSNESLEGVLSYLRMQPERHNPSTVRIAIRPLTDTEARKDAGAMNPNSVLKP